MEIWDPSITYIMQQRPQPFLYISLGLLSSMLLWLTFTIRLARDTHLRSVKQLLFYYLMPRQPERMLLTSDGEKLSVFYDDEFKVEKGEEHYLITTTMGHKIKTSMLERVTINVWDARARGMPTPFSLAWRWVASTIFVIYFSFLALALSYDDNRVSALAFLWKAGLISPDVAQELLLQVRHEQATNIMLSAIAFAVAIAWFLAYLFSFRQPQIELIELMLVPEAGNQYYGIPSLTPGTVHVIDFLRQVERLAGGEKDYKLIEISIPDSFRELVERIKKRLRIKDDDALVMLINNRIAAAEQLMIELGDMHKEMKIIRKAAEARLKHDIGRRMESERRRSLARNLAIILVIAITAFALGFTLGSNWSISVGAPSGTTTVTETTTLPSGPSPGEGVPYNGTTVTPAPPPPPPNVITVTATPYANTTTVTPGG